MKKDIPTRDSDSELEDDLRRLMHQQWDKLEPAISPRQVKAEAFVPFFLDSSSFFLKAVATSVFLCAYLMLFNASLKAVIIHPTTPVISSIAIPTPETPDTPRTPTPGNTQANCQINYITRAGETLTEIATRFSMPAQQILAENKLDNASNIPAGTSLIIRSCRTTEETSIDRPNQSGTFTPANE